MIASAPEKNSAAMFSIIATLFTSDLQYSSMQIPICPTYSKTMLQSNRKMASVQPPCGRGSFLTSEHDIAAEEEEWLAVNEREDGSIQIREVTAEEEQGEEEMLHQQIIHAECANANGSRCYLGKKSLDTQGTYLERENL